MKCPKCLEKGVESVLSVGWIGSSSLKCWNYGCDYSTGKELMKEIKDRENAHVLNKFREKTTEGN